jgi:hypothetical protein
MSVTVPYLDDEGNPSIATALLGSHHAFRRDIARFAMALGRVAQGDGSRATALREEWQHYREALHGHHEAEDSGIFPGCVAERPSLAPLIEKLTADHRKIDPLLERGDRAFAALPDPAAIEGAVRVIGDLAALLDPHLALEEAEVIPVLRAQREFPAPPDDAMADLYAQGFAWSMAGLPADVLARLLAWLPESLTRRLPAARAAYEERAIRVWGEP